MLARQKFKGRKMALRRVEFANRFPLGKLLMTRGVNDQVAEREGFAKFVMDSLRRHARADWGEMDPGDKAANDEALALGVGRLFSAYLRNGQPKIWIITESTGEATTILFPSEY